MDSHGYAEDLARRCRQALEDAGHAGCLALDAARYVPESGAVVCGCGEFADAPQFPAPGERTMVRKGGSVAYEPRDPIDSALALIDPTRVYAPEEVERHILDVLSRLECGALFERQVILAASEANDAWDRCFHNSIHTSQQSAADRRKSEAIVACDAAGLTEKRREANYLRDAVKTTMHNLRSTLTGYQSVSRSVGASYQAGGSVGRDYPGR